MEAHFDVEASFGAGFDEHHVELTGLCIAFLDRHLPARIQTVTPRWGLSQMRGFIVKNASGMLPFVYQVGFVADEDDDHITPPLRSNLLNPPGSVDEGLPVCSQAA